MDAGRALLTTWNDDPWAGESYSALTVAVADGDDELIAAPAGRVHIAGEHTAGAWAGLMEGALRSGARAADEVLTAALRPRSWRRWRCRRPSTPPQPAASCRSRDAFGSR